ncbi:MAG: DUF2059 domain-containing protein [Paracoccaceae bacterium]
MRTLAVAATLSWGVFASGLAAEQELAERLAETLRVSDVVQILHREGLEQGRQLNANMLGDTGGAYFAAQVESIYDPDDMVAALTDALAEHMSGVALQETLDFFGSPVGQRIIALEISAREAYSLPDVQEMAVAQLEDTPESDSRLKLVRTFVEANDLVARNVEGVQAADFSFYRGLSEGGGIPRDDTGYLATMLEGRDELLAETEEWALSFHYMAYKPLTEAEQQANIDFSLSASGQELNDALFDGFERMYNDIFYQMGRLVARSMATADL